MKPLITLALFLLPALVSAQEYTTLVNIPVETGQGFDNFINTLYALSIGIAALLAVIKIVIAGVKYMLTDIVTSKESAKKDIKGALLGLTIVLAAVLILTLINPQLVNVNFDPEPVETVIPANPISPPTESADVGPSETKLPLSTAMLPPDYPVDETTLETVCTNVVPELCAADLPNNVACVEGTWSPTNNPNQGECIVPSSDRGGSYYGFDRGSNDGTPGQPTLACASGGGVRCDDEFGVMDSPQDIGRRDDKGVSPGETASYPFLVPEHTSAPRIEFGVLPQGSNVEPQRAWLSTTPGGPPIMSPGGYLCETEITTARSFAVAAWFADTLDAAIASGASENYRNACRINRGEAYFFNIENTGDEWQNSMIQPSINFEYFNSSTDSNDGVPISSSNNSSSGGSSGGIVVTQSSSGDSSGSSFGGYTDPFDYLRSQNRHEEIPAYLRTEEDQIAVDQTNAEPDPVTVIDSGNGLVITQTESDSSYLAPYGNLRKTGRYDEIPVDSRTELDWAIINKIAETSSTEDFVNSADFDARIEEQTSLWLTPEFDNDIEEDSSSLFSPEFLDTLPEEDREMFEEGYMDQFDIEYEKVPYSYGGASCGSLASYSDLTEDNAMDELTQDDAYTCVGKNMVDGCIGSSYSSSAGTVYIQNVPGMGCSQAFEIEIEGEPGLMFCPSRPSSNLIEDIEELGVQKDEAIEELETKVRELASTEASLSAARSDLEEAEEALADAEDADAAAEVIDELSTEVDRLQSIVVSLEVRVGEINLEIEEIDELTDETYAAVAITASINTDACEMYFR